MIKNIGNSFLGGFFRRLGSIFALFFILAFIGYLLKDLDTNDFVNSLLGIQKVNASSTDFTPLNRSIGIYDCTSATNCNSKPVSRSTFTYNNNTYNSYTYDGTLTIASNGVGFSFSPQTILKSGYLYSATLYYCDWQDLSSVTSSVISGGLPGQEIDNYYRTSTTTRLNGFSASGLSNYCYYTTSVFAPKSNSATLSLRLKKSSGSITGFTPYVYGYKLDELGIYSSEIDSIVKSAISSSGLATSSAIESVIENQNENTNQEIESQKVCTDYIYNKDNVNRKRGFIGNTGVIFSSSDWFYTDYLSVQEDSTYTLFTSYSGVASYCLYSSDKNLISCQLLNGTFPTNVTITNQSFIRISFKENVDFYFKGYSCLNGNQALNNSIDNTNKQLEQTNNFLNSSDTTDAESEASDLFTNNQYETHGITGIITAPLNLIESLVNKTCSPLSLPLPFVDRDLTLPCLSSIYSENFPSFLIIYQIIISALIGYRICVSVFFMVKDFKNPDSDKIEVLDL